VHVKVPASSANLGPGFDALGMALSLHFECGFGDVPEGASQAEERHPAVDAFRRAGGTGPLWVRGRIPMGRGLGFSGAARVGGIVAAHAQRGVDDVADVRREVLHLATDLEGHPDNVAASLVGGVTASAGGEVAAVPVAFPASVVVWIPDFTTSTDKSRTAIPPQLSLADAVFNIGRATLLLAALASGDRSVLREATRDRLHQDRRLADAPASAEALRAALASDSLAAWLSGSGPTVAALCDPATAPSVAAALPGGGTVKVLDIDLEGARLVATP
jgi:homoserine kinase